MSIEAEPQAIEEDADAIEEVADDATLDDGQVSELAPDDNASAESEEKVTFDDKQQAKLDELLGERVGRQREAERRNAELESQLAEARAQIPEPVRPSVPELPDPFDDDFAAKMAARDQRITEAAAHDAREAANTELRQQAEQQAQVNAQQQQANRLQSYGSRAAANGIPAQELANAMQTIMNGGDVGSKLVADAIMDEDDGTLVMHLSKNPLELDKLRNMSDLEAVRYIDKVKPTLSGKRASSAPSPATRSPSGGAPPKPRGPKGAKYW